MAEKRVLERLRVSEPWEKVVADSGKSSLYKGLGLYFEYARPMVQELQATIAEKEKRLDRLNRTYTDLEASVASSHTTLDENSKRVDALADQEKSLKNGVEGLEKKRKILVEEEAALAKRGIHIEVLKALKTSDVSSSVELIKRIETVAKSEAEEKKLTETEQATQRLLTKNSDMDKKFDTTKQNVASWEVKLAEVKGQAKLYEESNLIVRNAFARGYSPDTVKMLFNLLERFEVKGMPDASVKRLIRGFDGVKELTELDYHKRRQNAEIEQGNADLAKVKGTTASIMNTSIPTLNQVTAKGIAEITAVQKAAVENINELSQQQQGQLTRMEENAEVNLAFLKDSAIEQQQGTLAILNQTMLNLSATFSQYRKDIQQWGAMKAETGKFQTELKWGQYIQHLLNDPKLAAEMSTPLALQLADWLNIWVGKRLPEAKSLPPEYLSKQESGLSRYFPVKFTNITEWVRYELRDLLTRGVI